MSPGTIPAGHGAYSPEELVTKVTELGYEWRAHPAPDPFLPLSAQ
jgi:hypothetical protein